MTEPDSSPDTTIVESADIDTATKDVAPAESSAADSGGESLVAKIQAALAPKESPDSEEPDQSSDDEDEAPEQEEGSSEEEDDDAISDEELVRLSKKTRRRVKRLLNVIDEKNSELAAVSPKAEAFDKVVSQVREAGLEAGEVDWLLTKLGRNLKRDPIEAYKLLTPIYQRLASIAGDTLPPELDSQVRTGKITREAAQALVLSRSQATLASQEAERLRQERAEAEQARATNAQVDKVRSAGTEWEQRQVAADPDWQLKQPQVMELIELEFGRLAKAGQVLTVETAVKVADAAKKTVDDRMKRLAPKPAEIRPVIGVASSASSPKPVNAVEAAKLALAGMR